MTRSILCAAVLAVLAACGDNLDRNRAPTLAELRLSTAEDTPLTITAAQLAAVDLDRDILTIDLAAPGHGTLAGRAPWTYTPAADYNGEDRIDVTVSDGVLSATATLVITVTPVNDAPVAVDNSFAAREDQPLVIAQSTLLANDTDVDTPILSILSVGSATAGTVAITGDDVTFTPSADFTGSGSFMYTVSDGALTDTATVTVTVGGVNDPPVAVADAFTVAEDTVLELLPSELLDNDTDAEGQTLEVEDVDTAVGGTVAIDPARTRITFTPTPNFHGAASFRYTIDDGAAVASATVSVTVTSVNDAPVAGDDTATTAEDTPIDLAVVALLGNDHDADGDTVSITEVRAAANGTAVLVGGTITFTPAPDFHGAASFEYVLSDGTGTETGTDVGTVAINVTSVNDRPVLAADAVELDEDVARVIPVVELLVNDTDADGDTLVVVAVQSATHGRVALDRDAGTVTFTPDHDYAGPASFEYVVSDGTTTAVGAVAVTVDPVDDGPVVADDAVTTAEDTAIVIPVADLLTNDRDPDGDGLAVTAVGNPQHGTVVLDAGNVTFTPTGDFHGAASFEYTVTAGTASAVGTVRVTVTSVNDAPVVAPDAAATGENTPVIITVAELLANDRDADVEDTLAVVAVQSGVHGTPVLAAGRVTFTPEPGFSGTASFEYVVSDTHTTSNGSVTVTVNDAPIASADAITVSKDAPRRFVLTGSDANGDLLTFAIATGPAHGTVALAGSVAVYTPAPGYVGADSLSYQVSDGVATSAPTPVAITVSTCADGVLDASEECDDGNHVDGDGCDDGCTVSSCGNGVSSGLLLPTSVTLEWLAVSCFHDAALTFSIDGHVIHTQALPLDEDCPCELPIGAVTLIDPAVLALLAHPATVTVALRDLAHYLGWARMTLRDASSSRTIVLFDADGGGDALAGRTNICDAGVRDDLSVEVSVLEECDDGNTDAGDGCDRCHLGCAPTSGASRAVVDPASGHCFAAFDDEALDYAGAEALCVARGGHLASLTGAGDSAQLRALVAPGSRPWIGLDDRVTEGTFAWLSGEPVAFTDWHAGQPDDASDAEDCAALAPEVSTGSWIDVSCDAVHTPIVCEIP